MWRADENELIETSQPFVTRQCAVVAGAAGDEATHAVPDEYQFGQRHRPELHQGFEPFGERTPVWRRYGGRCCSANRPACTRGRAPARRMVVSLVLPLQVVHAQVVQQDDEPVGIRDRRSQQLAFVRQRDTPPMQDMEIANGLFDAAG